MRNLETSLVKCERRRHRTASAAAKKKRVSYQLIFKAKWTF